jgi:hypothetical protein
VTAHSSALDLATTLISGLLELDVPIKKSGEDEYLTFRKTAGKEMVHFWESLGGLEHRRALSVFRVRNILRRNDDVEILDASLAAVVGLPQVFLAFQEEEAHAAHLRTKTLLISRHGEQAEWCTGKVISSRLEWLGNLSKITLKHKTSLTELLISDCRNVEDYEGNRGK